MEKKLVNLYTYARVSSESQTGNSSLPSQFERMEKAVNRWNKFQTSVQFNLIQSKSLNESATGIFGQLELMALIKIASKDKNGAILVSDSQDRYTRHVAKVCEAEKKGLNIYCAEISSYNGYKPVPYLQLQAMATEAAAEPLKIHRRTCIELAYAWENPNKFLYQRGKHRTEIDCYGNKVQVLKVGKREAEKSAENRWKRKFGDTFTGNSNKITYEKIKELKSQGKTFLEIGQYLDRNIELYPINSIVRKDSKYIEKHNLLTSKEKRRLLISGEWNITDSLQMIALEKQAKNKELASRGWITSIERVDKNGNVKTVLQPNRVYALYRDFLEKETIKTGERLEVKSGVLYFGDDSVLNQYINSIINNSSKREIARLLNAKGVKSKKGGAIHAQTVTRLQAEIKEQLSKM